MIDNITYLADVPLHRLRAWTHAGARGPKTPLVPGVYFSWGEHAGDVRVDVTATPGDLLSAQVDVTGAPEWLTLNIELGTTDFHPGDVVGIVAEMHGLSETEARVNIRSSYDGKVFDTDLQDKLAGSANRTVRTVMHTVGAQDALTRWGGFHTLMVHLPKRNCAVTLTDLRIFLISSAAGLRSGAVTFAHAVC